MSRRAIGVLVVLLLIPVYALVRLATWLDWRVLVGVPIALSVFTYFSYRSDKCRAESGAWRIPESTLHLAELIGGWPGAFLAQRVFRHKTAKRSYQFVFWLIVAAHEFVALDSLLGWKATALAAHFIRSQMA
ncbi:MAG TPA: DUF1294 domain-containing protein [Opitutaceae bacterium]|nr:DUF1294 domain-containing protein [Opitutaceae bacterium]